MVPDAPYGNEDNPRPPRRGRGTRPSPEAKAARQQSADARKSNLARKKRTRELIQMGGVCAAHGFTSPDQVDELLKALATRDSWAEWLEKRGVDLKRETI